MSPAASSSEGPAGAAFCPYVGLAPFEENHANYYFGRDVDAANLADNVLFAPITVLFGASGVGKTSLLNVGLRRALLGLDHQAAVVLFRHWQSSEFRSLLICDIVRAGEMQTINMSKAPRSLPEIASAFTKENRKSLILGFDQFEEYFVYQEGISAQQFEAELDALASDDTLDAHILMAIREDRFHLLDRLRATVSGVLENTLELAHFDDAAVRDAIIKPIQVYNKEHLQGAEPIEVNDTFVETLITQLKQVETTSGKGALESWQERKIELPYLQLALEEIWKAEAKDWKTGDDEAKILDESVLRKRAVKQIVRDHLDDVMGALREDDQTLCADMFDRLVTPSGAKIAMTVTDLAKYAYADSERVKRILEDLSARSRIFALVPQPHDEPAY